jgi:hypothetical protein
MIAAYRYLLLTPDIFHHSWVVDMSEQNRKYITKEIGKLLSEIWRIKGCQSKNMAQITLSPKAEQHACRGPDIVAGEIETDRSREKNTKIVAFHYP